MATMNNCILSLKQYLLHSKKILPTALTTTKKIDIVIGNQSGDCDSIVSSILHAYYLFSTKKADNDIFPILSMPEEDLKLRGAESVLLKNCGIESSDLIFTDQIPWENIHTNIDKVTLVDHNVLSDSMNFLNTKIYEIIDHHKDESQYIDNVNSSRRNIEKVGSCSTLIAENYLHASNNNIFFNNNNNNNNLLLDDNMQNVALLLLSTILLDTMNLSPEAKKATQKDIDIVNKFQSLFKQWDDTTCKKMFEDLHSVKFNPTFWLALTTLDKLRLDYKQYSSSENNILGISAVLIPFETFIDDKNFIKDCISYMSMKNLNVLVIMTMTLINGAPSRELFIISRKENQMIFDKIIKCLETSDLKVTLQLEDNLKRSMDNYNKNDTNNVNGDDDGIVTRCYSQGLITGSRKVVAPLLKDVL